jgi:hypothetical protein
LFEQFVEETSRVVECVMAIRGNPVAWENFYNRAQATAA